MTARQETEGKITQKLHQNVAKAQEKQKKDFRKRHFIGEPQDLVQAGSYCWVKTQQRGKMGKKAAAEGPYKLLQWKNGRALICDAANKRWEVNASRVAPYHPLPKDRNKGTDEINPTEQDKYTLT